MGLPTGVLAPLLDRFAVLPDGGGESEFTQEVVYLVVVVALVQTYTLGSLGSKLRTLVTCPSKVIRVSVRSW